MQTVTVRRADDRGATRIGWLDSRHTFSFGDYGDPDHVGFRALRVINDDRVAPGAGFPAHPHREMEIFSYVLEGQLEHRDSLGNGRVLEPGEIQLMSAGTGVTHSEFNPSRTRPAHFLQVWIQPGERRREPSYTEWRPTEGQRSASKVVVISPDGRDGSAVIHQDAEVYVVRLSPDRSVSHELRPGRGLWLQVARGALRLSGVDLDAGDGASSERAGSFEIDSSEGAEALLFDLA